MAMYLDQLFIIDSLTFSSVLLGFCICLVLQKTCTILVWYWGEDIPKTLTMRTKIMAQGQGTLWNKAFSSCFVFLIFWLRMRRQLLPWDTQSRLKSKNEKIYHVKMVLANIVCSVSWTNASRWLSIPMWKEKQSSLQSKVRSPPHFTKGLHGQ